MKITFLTLLISFCFTLAPNVEANSQQYMRLTKKRSLKSGKKRYIKKKKVSKRKKRIKRRLPKEYSSANSVAIKKKRKLRRKSDRVSTRRAALGKSKKSLKRKRKLRKKKKGSSSKESVFTTTQSITKVRKAPFREYTEKFYFNYFVQYLGRSLSDNYQDGATYNRFNTGQDYKGDPNDATGPFQMFHAITLGYNLAKDYKISYGYTFQDNLNNDIEYEFIDFNGNTATGVRNKGVSDNNKRVNLFVSNIANNKYFSFHSNFFYEFASTVASQDIDTEYGLGFEPVININTGIDGFYTGFTGLFQRNYYKNQQINTFVGTDGNTYDLLYPTRYQTLLAEVSAYANYSLSDYTMFKSSIRFDWDQRGDQVNSSAEFNKNLDDVGRVGFDFLVDYGVTAGTFLEFALEDPNIEKTAIGATLTISLY